MSNILIVDDDGDLRNIWELYLRRMGHEVHHAVNGVEALYMARDYQPDLVVLDLMMPMASGDLVLGFIRSTDELRRIPVLVVSAHHDLEDLAEQYQADAYLRKPVGMQEFQNAVTALISASA